jgi:poly(A) polymerase
MLRAARFASQLGFTVAPEVVEAMRAMAGRLEIVSVERISDELSKLLLGRFPRAGLELLVDTGLADQVLPELPALRLEIDEWHQHKDVYDHTLQVLERAIALEEDGPDLVLRLARCCTTSASRAPAARSPAAGCRSTTTRWSGRRWCRRRLKALRFPKDVVAASRC